MHNGSTEGKMNWNATKKADMPNGDRYPALAGDSAKHPCKASTEPLNGFFHTFVTLDEPCRLRWISSLCLPLPAVHAVCIGNIS